MGPGIASNPRLKRYVYQDHDGITRLFPELPWCGNDTGYSMLLTEGDLFFAADLSMAGVELPRIPDVGAYTTGLGQAGSQQTLAVTAPVLGSSVTITAHLQVSFPNQSWSLTQVAPLAPSLIGTELNLQAWTLPAGLFPVSASNGLRLVLGN